MNTCKNCQAHFEVTAEDLAFYDKISPVIARVKYNVPAPTFCPDCRLQRRLMFRNERSLHYRSCSVSGRKIVSMYSPEVNFPVYDNEEWWKDGWSGLDFGRDFDFSRTFTDQFYDLMSVVPKMARVQQGENVNSQFTNCSSNNKNCYLAFSTNGSEDCMYSTQVDRSKDCVDCYQLFGSELCYECVDGVELYNCMFVRESAQCSDSAFLFSCRGCKDCFGCVGLRASQYCIFNQQYSREDYFRELEKWDLENSQILESLKNQFYQFMLQFPYKFYNGVQNENVTGNYLTNSKNAFECYDSLNLEDCKWCTNARYFKDSYDVSYYGSTGDNQLIYETEGVGHGINSVAFSKLIWGGSSNVYYCYECFACKDCFGCTGLKHKQYCIFNKQYTKEAYLEMLPRIIEHMVKMGEWGEFFHSSLTPFCYNETVAFEYFPLEQEIVEQAGYKWLFKNNLHENFQGELIHLPNVLSETTDQITTKILKCQSSGKLYKIVPKELDFYRNMNVALPRICHDERHINRIKLRNPRKLWGRNCQKCNVVINTVYAPNRPEKVYCENCYLEVVY